jgi:hypothetical protein
MLHGVSWRVWLFLVLCLLGVAGVGAYFHRIVQRHPAPKPDSKLEGRAPIAEAAAPPATAKKKEAGTRPWGRTTEVSPSSGCRFPGSVPGSLPACPVKRCMSPGEWAFASRPTGEC